MNENIPGDDASTPVETTEGQPRQPYVAPRIERLDVQETRFGLGSWMDGTTLFSS